MYCQLSKAPLDGFKLRRTSMLHEIAVYNYRGKPCIYSKTKQLNYMAISTARIDCPSAAVCRPSAAVNPKKKSKFLNVIYKISSIKAGKHYSTVIDM